MKKFLALMIVLLTLLSVNLSVSAATSHVPVQGGNNTEVEYNNDEYSSNIIPFINGEFGLATGYIDYWGDWDMYMFTCSSNKTITTKLTNERVLSADTSFFYALFDETDGTCKYWGYIPNDIRTYICPEFQGLAGHTYRIEISVIGSEDAYNRGSGTKYSVRIYGK